MVKEFRVQSKIHGGELKAVCQISDNSVSVLSIVNTSGKGPVFIPMPDDLIQEVKTLVSLQLAG